MPKINRKFTNEEIGLIHRTMMPKASQDDVAIFVATCERTGLDPFARQIMPQSRNTRKDDQWVTVWGSLTTIDGLRKIAVDSGEYEGQEGPWWCGEDGVWADIWTKKGPCFAAKVMVHRRGFRVGLVGTAKYASYVQTKKDGTPNQVWANLGDHMTAKVAEALALRRAFPNEMAGLYTADEMAQAGIEAPEGLGIDPKTPITQAPPNGWTEEAQGQFADLLDTQLYNLYKQGGHPELFTKESEKWHAAKKVDPAGKVLAGLSARIKTLENAAGAALAKKAEGTERSTAASAGQGETPPDDPGPSEPAGASLDDGPAIGTPEYAELAKRALNDACMRFQKCYETQNVADPKKYVLEMRTKVLGELKFVGDEHLDQKKMMLAEAMQNRADKLKIP